MDTVKQQAVSMITTLPETVNLDEIIQILRQLQKTPVLHKPGSLEKKSISFLEAAKNYLGYLKEFPPDLSTNKHYMDGYGL